MNRHHPGRRDLSDYRLDLGTIVFALIAVTIVAAICAGGVVISHEMGRKLGWRECVEATP